jgi:hypothetical protein
VDLGHETGAKGPDQGALEDVEAEVWDAKELVRVRGVPGDVGKGVGGEEASSSLDEGGIPAADDDALVPGRLGRDGIEGGGDGREELVSVIVDLFYSLISFSLSKHNNSASRSR